jgi:hypothetical protein
LEERNHFEEGVATAPSRALASLKIMPPLKIFASSKNHPSRKLPLFTQADLLADCKMFSQIALLQPHPEK